MANLLSVIGYIGTGLVIGAYAPQISHLWTEHCSAGISERAYALWALASRLHVLILKMRCFRRPHIRASVDRPVTWWPEKLDRHGARSAM
jgi:PQ loop repeat